MKKVFFFSTIVFICICYHQSAAQQQEEKKTTHPLSEIPAQVDDKSVLPSNTPAETPYGKLLSKVTTTKSSFNPSQSEEVIINYHLIKPAKIILHMYDPDWRLIRTIESEKLLAPGDQSITWDGKDMDGKTVPDEAYFFTIIAEEETGVKEIYDPTTFSGGLEEDITSANVSSETGTITYKLPQMTRVMIRTGVQGGPLLNTLVDWQPRVKGTITEYWNGKDKDNVVDLYDHPKFKMIIAYFTLPENSIITYGNKAMTYKDYKKSLSAERPVKEERSSSVQNPSSHYRLPRLVDYSPDVKVNFENIHGTDRDGTIILKGRTMVKVDLEDEDKRIFQNQQFEICFFLDHEFYAEDEAGYTPFNWVWDLSNVSEGEHVFTVNLSSFKDQIGVFSRKIKVVK